MRDCAAAAIISANVQRLMHEQDMNVEDLARMTDEYPATVRHTVYGKVVPGATRLHRIAKALGVTMDSLMEPTGAKE